MQTAPAQAPQLTLHLGPMASSKSDALITAALAAESVGRPVLTLQPARNTRDGARLSSRTGRTFPATAVSSVGQIYGLGVWAGAGALLVLDEAHLLPGTASDLVETVAALLEAKIGLCIAALDIDHEGRAYEPAASLRQIDGAEVVRHTADCSVHGAGCRAGYSWCRDDAQIPPVGDVGREYLVLCAEEFWGRLTRRVDAREEAARRLEWVERHGRALA